VWSLEGKDRQTYKEAYRAFGELLKERLHVEDGANTK
jgi:hypothetical protein